MLMKKKLFYHNILCLMLILIITMILVIIYIYVYNRVDNFYLEPIRVDKYKFDIENNKDKVINIDNLHIAIYKKRNTDRILLISCGNHGNLDLYYDKIELFERIYDYDILCYEYPGFGTIDKEYNIDNCIKETYYWIQYIKNLGYKTFDFMGYSLGGGIMMECLNRYNITFANNIYLVATFTSISDLLFQTNYGNYLIQGFFLKKDNLNTFNNLKNTYCNKLYIIHSKDDERIPFNLAIKNYLSNSNFIKNKIFIEIKGNHKELIFEPNIKL
jgi:hypothetical protein